MFRDNQAFSSFSVNDVEAARQFYGDVLGLRVETNEMGFLDVHLGGGAKVLVYPKDDHQPATFTVLNFMVPDIDAAVDGLAAAGVQMQRYDGFDQDERGIARDATGAIAWFTDPAGNVIAVIAEREAPSGG
jgi:catechol 2,3-dioxygenase-like lactoylglutathione lyase family enzyme